jgi:3-phosphoshikimate 1-carboxyvinyltransferase
MLAAMAAFGTEHRLSISRSGPLRGGTLDLNTAPDLLPALVNVAHARMKETDRIAVMTAELARLGIRCTELPGKSKNHKKKLTGR